MEFLKLTKKKESFIRYSNWRSVGTLCTVFWFFSPGEGHCESHLHTLPECWEAETCFHWLWSRFRQQRGHLLVSGRGEKSCLQHLARVGRGSRGPSCSFRYLSVCFLLWLTTFLRSYHLLVTYPCQAVLHLKERKKNVFCIHWHFCWHKWGWKTGVDPVSWSEGPRNWRDSTFLPSCIPLAPCSHRGRHKTSRCRSRRKLCAECFFLKFLGWHIAVFILVNPFFVLCIFGAIQFPFIALYNLSLISQHKRNSTN